MPTTFQGTVGTTPAIQATTFTGLTTLTTTGYGIKVVLPSANTGKMYYGFTSGVLISTGCHIPNGVPFTINPAEFPLANGKPDLTALYFVSDTAGQTLTGVVL